MVEVAVAVPSRNDFRDFVLLDRLLLSLHQSDFPQSYPLFLTIGYGWGSRRDSVDRVLKCTHADCILVCDNDTYVPPVWWNEVVRIFATDEKIGAINPLINGQAHQRFHDGFMIFRRQFLLDTGIRDSRFNPDIIQGWRVVIADTVSIKHDNFSGIGIKREEGSGEIEQQHT